MSVADTAQHIRLLTRKRERLAEALIEAERQFATAVAREFAAGQMTWGELLEAYETVRAAGIKGFATRWLASVPYTVQRIKQMVAIEDIDEWFGEGREYDSRYPYPPRGVCVVYVLFSETNAPVYVGSSGNLSHRLATHRREKPGWQSWRAYKARDRAHAYELERQFLTQHLPAMNKQRW